MVRSLGGTLGTAYLSVYPDEAFPVAGVDLVAAEIAEF